MKMKQRIESKIRGSISVEHLQITDESHMHNVPTGAESHWRILVVSDDFVGMRSVQRHRRLYGALKQEMASSIHALAVDAFTTEEFTSKGREASKSPPCLGGSKPAG